MSLPLVPTTELEAVNVLLSYIGEQPVNSLDTSGISEASIAQNTLHEVSRKIQSQGLNCNTESGYELAVDVNGNVNVPPNVIKLDVTSSDSVMRGSKLYDKANHTYVFTEAQECDITWFLSFDELPQCVREYVTIRAARIFITKVLGSDTLASLTERDEQEAFLIFRENEIDTGRYSIFDSQDVSRVVSRTTNPRGR